MNAERRDATIMAWLEEGPARLPSTARRAIEVGIRTTRQEQGWRAAVARLVSRLGLQALGPIGAAAVLVLLAVGALALLTQRGDLGGPGPTAPTPSAPPTVQASPSLAAGAWPPFTSERHGYTIRHPADWPVTPATEPWLYGTGMAGGPGNPEALDRFNSDMSTSRILATSQLLPDELTEADWIDGYRTPVVEAFGEQCFPPPEEWDRQTIDGVELGIYVGCNFVEAIAFNSGRAYTFTLDNTFTTPDPSSRPIYDEMLRSITFHPETADDTPVGPTPSR